MPHFLVIKAYTPAKINSKFSTWEDFFLRRWTPRRNYFARLCFMNFEEGRQTLSEIEVLEVSAERSLMGLEGRRSGVETLRLFSHFFLKLTYARLQN
ncbi:hypothetical protein AVEN_244397-1 [Araneus ventricosus]|uniref:Uncharacterized protein n=1 Tax=Araneus ventricosus TaxID=182803 RepID=A0A4Y2R144_ARAVE|nr:hypothetical protein AVEN_244397-1 [Araneus ventricosus]